MRIAVVEDHPLFRDALVRGWREVGYDVVFAVGAVSAVPTDLRNLCRTVDILVVDVALPDGSGVDLARQVMSTCGERVRIVVLSSHDDVRTVIDARDSGCSAFVSKTVGLEQLIAVLRLVAQGGVSFPNIASHVDEARVNLSSRELDCLALVAEGFSNREIAETLGVSQETIKTTLGNARNKLGANDRAHAVALALEQNILRRRT